MDGWTQVRYGRRRQRYRQAGWDQGYGWSSGWKDRAPPSSYGRRDRVPYPSRPVPPPRAARYTGPQSRSYAAVVRQDDLRPARAGSEIRREPADPQFGRLVRKMHTLIKMVHHLQNVSQKPGKPEPRMIARMVEILADMIKPAAPTQRTMDMIYGNAKNWGHNTYLILMEHYEAGVEDLLKELSGLLTTEWKNAFEVAVRWAKRNLPRITRDEIDHAEALIAARIDTGDPVQAQPPQQRQQSQQTVQKVIVQTQSLRKTTTKSSVATMTDPKELELDWFRSSPRADSPRERREEQGGARRTRGQVLTEDNILQETEPEDPEELGVLEVPPLSPRHLELIALFDEMQAEEERLEADVQARQTSRQTIAQVHQEDAVEEDVFEESTDHFTSPQPPRFRAYRHPNTQRKLTDWALNVHRKWLFIGDSNLGNLPDYFNKDLQVESFPGAHFRHAQALMEKTIPPDHVEVEKVILSFGLNSRANRSKETTVKNLQGAIRSTKRKFPYAEIWIPLVNFSSALPLEERENLETLNEHIEKNMPFIPLLPENQFQTEADDVHWTAETGSAIFDHWMAVLNSRTP